MIYSGVLSFILRPGDLLHGRETLERRSVRSQPKLARAGERRGPKLYQHLHRADWRSPQSYHGKKKKEKKTQLAAMLKMPSWKPKCQTVWHTLVQGLINCPAHCFHPKPQAGLRDSESPKQFIWKFQTLKQGLPKLPKCWLFIWKAIIMLTWGCRGGGGGWWKRAGA